MASTPKIVEQPTVKPDRPTFRDRHRPDAQQWQGVGETLAQLTQRLATRELKFRKKKQIIPMVNILVDTGRAVVRELSREPDDEEDDT